jgi:hypothetical protein
MDDMIIKRGETILQYRYRRTIKGLKVWMKAHSLIEELIKEWTAKDAAEQAITTRLINYGRQWTGEDLRVYELVRGLEPRSFGDGEYTLADPGQELIQSRSGMVNLGFLRLVGISSQDGVTFTVDGVYSPGEIKRIEGLISRATKRFYTDFLLPVELEVTISTQEMRG